MSCRMSFMIRAWAFSLRPGDSDGGGGSGDNLWGFVLFVSSLLVRTGAVAVLRSFIAWDLPHLHIFRGGVARDIHVVDGRQWRRAGRPRRLGWLCHGKDWRWCMPRHRWHGRRNLWGVAPSWGQWGVLEPASKGIDGVSPLPSMGWWGTHCSDRG